MSAEAGIGARVRPVHCRRHAWSGVLSLLAALKRSATLPVTCVAEALYLLRVMYLVLASKMRPFLFIPARKPV
jgi:hypothetical protein